MAFVTKEWKDRLVEFAGRRKLTNVSTGEEMIVDVARNEGTVSQEGDAFSAANMNNLEQRVANEFNNINTNLTHVEFISLYETSALAVMAHIKQKWYEYNQYYNGFRFNFRVNNANWYSGIMYSDYTNTWWGIVQERNSGIDTIKTYQYFGDSAGADSVRPFKSQQDVDNAYNTGYSAGYSDGKSTITAPYIGQLNSGGEVNYNIGSANSVLIHADNARYDYDNHVADFILSKTNTRSNEFYTNGWSASILPTSISGTTLTLKNNTTSSLQVIIACNS